MTVRTAYIGTATALSVLTAANLNKAPGGWIGYAEVTANQSTITTEVDLTGLTVTVTVGTSRRVRITGHINVTSSVGDLAALSIKESATVLQDTGIGTGASASIGGTSMVVLTPTSGAHTYKLTFRRAAGSGNVGLVASATIPSFILVEDMGPA